MTAELASLMEMERQADAEESKRRPWPAIAGGDEAEQAALLLMRFCSGTDCRACRFNDHQPDHKGRAAYCRLAGFPYAWRQAGR